MLILHHFCSVPSLKPHGLLICKMGRWAIAVWVVAMLIAAKFLQIANLINNGPLNQRHSIERLNLAIVHGIFEIPFNDCLISLVEVLLNVPLKHSAASIPFVKPTLVVCFFEHLLWSFGLHGSAIIVFPSFEPLWIMNMAENLSAGAQNIVTFTFYENGAWMGGSGATLPVVVYMLVFAKSKLLKNVGKVGIAPGLFNINEPVTFGLPIVLNPILMIPYILSPMAAMSVQYLGTAVGLFPLCNNMVPWTCPVLISGFLTTGSVMGVVAQLCGLAVSFLIWLPFIRVWDQKCYQDELAVAAPAGL